MIYMTLSDDQARTPSRFVPPHIDANGVLHFNGKEYVERDQNLTSYYIVGDVAYRNVGEAIKAAGGHTLGCSKWAWMDANIEVYDPQATCNLCRWTKP